MGVSHTQLSDEDRFDPIFCVRCRKIVKRDEINSEGLCSKCQKQVEIDTKKEQEAEQHRLYLFSRKVYIIGSILIPVLCVLAHQLYWWCMRYSYAGVMHSR